MREDFGMFRQQSETARDLIAQALEALPEVCDITSLNFTRPVL
jgi:hypothetical protein